MNNNQSVCVDVCVCVLMCVCWCVCVDVCGRDGDFRPRRPVPGEELHARLLGAQDLGHLWRHQTQAGSARPEREEHPPQRQPPVHRQHVTITASPCVGFFVSVRVSWLLGWFLSFVEGMMDLSACLWPLWGESWKNPEWKWPWRSWRVTLRSDGAAGMSDVAKRRNAIRVILHSLRQWSQPIHKYIVYEYEEDELNSWEESQNEKKPTLVQPKRILLQDIRC